MIGVEKIVGIRARARVVTKMSKNDEKRDTDVGDFAMVSVP